MRINTSPLRIGSMRCKLRCKQLRINVCNKSFKITDQRARNSQRPILEKAHKSFSRQSNTLPSANSTVVYSGRKQGQLGRTNQPMYEHKKMFGAWARLHPVSTSKKSPAKYWKWPSPIFANCTCESAFQFQISTPRPRPHPCDTLRINTEDIWSK